MPELFLSTSRDVVFISLIVANLYLFSFGNRTSRRVQVRRIRWMKRDYRVIFGQIITNNQRCFSFP